MIIMCTCKHKAAYSANEAREESIVREGASCQHIDELKDAREHDVGEINVDDLQVGRRVPFVGHHEFM